MSLVMSRCLPWSENAQKTSLCYVSHRRTGRSPHSERSCERLVLRYNISSPVPLEATYEDFRNDMVEAMKLGDGRYVIYDYEYPNKTTDLFFIMWYVVCLCLYEFRTPRNLTLLKNMVYASTMCCVKSQFQGIKHTLEAHDLEDISEERFIEVGKQNRLC